GEVQPTALVAALADPVRARVHEGTAVTAVAPGAGGVRIATTRGELEAGAVLLATNAWLPQLIAGLPVRPVRAQMLASAPWRTAVATRPVYAEWGFQYWRQLDDGRVLVGGFRNRAVDAEVG